MTENRFQFDIVLWFNHNYANLDGHLFMVNNDTFNAKDGSRKKAMGLKKSVSDLILLVPEIGKMACIEVKAPKSRHSADHIKNQLEWGEKVINNKGFYLMSSDFDTIKFFIDSLASGKLESAHNVMIKQMLHLKSQFDNKTILF